MPKAIVPWDCILSPDGFDGWQKKHKLTGAAVARIFGVRQQTVAAWRLRGAPMLVLWACAGYDRGYRPKGIEELIKPPIKATDGRRRSVPPHKQVQGRSHTARRTTIDYIPED